MILSSKSQNITPNARAPPAYFLADAFVELLKGEEQNEHSKNVCYY